MSVVSVIDTLVAWTQDNICSKIELKVPPRADDPNGAEIDYTTANPVAFPMYIPTADKLPPGLSQFPSICVRFMDGEDDLTHQQGTMAVQMCLSAWDPGIHGPDLFHPSETGGLCRQPKFYAEFTRTATGWRDIWNFVDVALREIESAQKIGSMSVDQSSIKYGPLVEQNSIPDYYPFWFAEISFLVTYPVIRNRPEKEAGEPVEQFL